MKKIQKKVKEKNKLPYFVMMRKIATASHPCFIYNSC